MNGPNDNNAGLVELFAGAAQGMGGAGAPMLVVSMGSGVGSNDPAPV